MDEIETNGRAYRIGELAKLSGVPIPTLRLWQERGFLGGKRSEGGHRLFGDRDLKWVLQARDLTQGRYMTSELAYTVSALTESSQAEVKLGQPVPSRAPRHDANYERMLDLAAQNARLFAEERDLTQKLQLIVDNFPDSIVTQDRQLRYTSAINPAFHRSEEMLGRTAWETLSAEDAEVLTRVKQGVIDTGEPARVVVRLTHRGQLRYYDMVIRPLRDSSGSIDGVIAYNRDITERMLLEEATKVELESLRRYERLFSSLMTGVADGVLVLNDRWEILDANDRAAEALGYSTRQLKGACLATIVRATGLRTLARLAAEGAREGGESAVEVPLKNGASLRGRLVDAGDGSDGERFFLLLLV